MAQRTVALCNGEYIGIETIYTVVSGRQINIPDKIRELRAKSQNDELFCPCGCGANLILVAGDKNLREQHFRIKDADEWRYCHITTEGKTSVDSKIVLKCWLDDNLHSNDLETRVPIYAISDSTRKYEFSFVSRNKGIAVNYCHDRLNLSDEKLQILEENANGIIIIHVVDSSNGGSEGQFPEGLMKIQNRQGYCLLLSVDDSDYNKANLQAIFYEKDIDGLWREISFADGALKGFRILPDRSIAFKGNNLTDLLGMAKKQFSEENDAKRKMREEAEKRRDEYLKQQQLEAEHWREEQRKRIEEAEMRRAEEEEKRRLEKARLAEEERKRDEDFRRNLEEYLNQQETLVKDQYGNRWIKCEFCGKMGKDSEFSSYGGAIGVHLNLGTCKQCADNNPQVQHLYQMNKSERESRPFDRTICPVCGGKLVERNGSHGKFIGCTGYPKCRYTRSIT